MSVPAVEVYDQHGNWLPVESVKQKTGGVLVIEVAVESDTPPEDIQ